MLNSLIHRLLKRRHFWRHASFSEVAELYASRLMRVFALRLVSTFTAVFLYQEGYSLLFIGLFFTAFYALKVPFSIPAARVIAAYGPKHATLYSNIVSAGAMFALPFASNPAYSLAGLGVFCLFQAFSGAMNDMAYLVDFSKVKHSDHAGKEIGFMNIVERIASGLSPLVGGLVAYFFGPESVMVLSAVLFVLSAAPLFLSAEPIRLQHGLDFSGFPWRTTFRAFLAESAIGADVFVTNIAWTLFLVVAVFVSGTDQVYAELGFVSSITILVAFVVSYGFGRLIDHRKGLQLLKASTYLNSSIHMLRGFVSTPVSVILVNSANELSTIGYGMPFMRGMFDQADRTGRRIEYMFVIEMVVNLGAALAALFFSALMFVSEQTISFRIFFVFLAAATLLIMAPRFPLYRK